ncbi:MAG: hypothetical protein H0U75_02460 [Legionella sp.]|nr:hypothetical protein [Legionella sp.]
MPRYHFNLSQGKLTSRVTGKPIKITPEQIAVINITSVTDVHTGWFNLVSDKYDSKDPGLVNEGKWVLSFPKNVPHLNTAWKQCV